MTYRRHINDARIVLSHFRRIIMLKFEMTEQNEQPVLSVRTHTSMDDLKATLGKAYQVIFRYLGEIGDSPAGAPFVGYYNMDMQNLDVEIGVPVAKPIVGKGEVIISSIPAGKQASCVYRGAYTQLGAAYEGLTKWIGDNGLIPTGVCYEFYLNAPEEVPENELLTKIVFLLK